MLANKRLLLVAAAAAAAATGGVWTRKQIIHRVCVFVCEARWCCSFVTFNAYKCRRLFSLCLHKCTHIVAQPVLSVECWVFSVRFSCFRDLFDSHRMMWNRTSSIRSSEQQREKVHERDYYGNEAVPMTMMFAIAPAAIFQKGSNWFVIVAASASAATVARCLYKNDVFSSDF